MAWPAATPLKPTWWVRSTFWRGDTALQLCGEPVQSGRSTKQEPAEAI
jgi:hypothetical protein